VGYGVIYICKIKINLTATMIRKRIKPNLFKNLICPPGMIGDYPIVMKGVHVVVNSKKMMSSINFINTKRKLKMKKIVTIIATLLATAAFATEPAKTATATASAPAAPAKEEMTLAKKKESPKQDATKSAKPATPAKDEKATAKTEPAKPAAPAVPATK
jgi:hypothetical protein